MSKRNWMLVLGGGAALVLAAGAVILLRPAPTAADPTESAAEEPAITVNLSPT